MMVHYPIYSPLLLISSVLLMYPSYISSSFFSSTSSTNISTAITTGKTNSSNSAVTTTTDDWRHSVVPKGWNSTNPLFPPYFTRRPILGTLPPNKITTQRPSLRRTSRPTTGTTFLSLSNLEIFGCVSSTGNIGLSSPNATLIPYYYRMILRNNNKTLPSTILPKLEIALTNQLIPTLFPTCSSPTHSNTQKQRSVISTGNTTTTNTSILLGMSSSPQDIVLSTDSSGVCNTSTISTTTSPSCYTLKGGLTLYVTGDAKSTDIASMHGLLQQSIQGLMNNGTLNSVDKSVVQLIYLGPTDPTLLQQSQDPTILTPKSSSISSDLSLGLILIGILLGIVIGAFGVRRVIRKRRLTARGVEPFHGPFTINPSSDIIALYDDSRKDIEGLEACVVEVKLNTRTTRIFGYQSMK